MSEKEQDLGRERLKEHLLPGEVFLTNYPSDNPEHPRITGQPRLGEIVVGFRKSGRYEAVRVVSSAYDKNGNLLPDMVAIVGIPVEQEAQDYLINS